MADPAPPREQVDGGVAAARAHDSADKHVTGEARFIDDLPLPADALTILLGRSAQA